MVTFQPRRPGSEGGVLDYSLDPSDQRGIARGARSYYRELRVVRFGLLAVFEGWAIVSGVWVRVRAIVGVQVQSGVGIIG